MLQYNGQWQQQKHVGNWNELFDKGTDLLKNETGAPCNNSFKRLILLTAGGRSHRQVMTKFRHSTFILQQQQQRFSIQRVGLFEEE